MRSSSFLVVQFFASRRRSSSCHRQKKKHKNEQQLLAADDDFEKTFLVVLPWSSSSSSSSSRYDVCVNEKLSFLYEDRDKVFSASRRERLFFLFFVFASLSSGHDVSVHFSLIVRFLLLKTKKCKKNDHNSLFSLQIIVQVFYLIHTHKHTSSSKTTRDR